MHFLLGNSHMKSRNYNSAIRSFERAQVEMRPHASPELLQLSLVSLLPTIKQCTETYRYLLQISGWKFDNLGTTIQRQLCEALHAAGHTKRAGEAVLEIANSFGDEMYTSDGLSKWVFGELIRQPYRCRPYGRLHRFHAPLLRHTRQRGKYNLCRGSKRSSVSTRVIDPPTAIERVGQSELGGCAMERCSDCCGRCESLPLC